MSSFIRIDGPPEFCRALASAIAEQMSARLDEVQCLDANQAAQLLGLTVPTFRNVVEREGLASTDFGERNTRWSLTEIKALKQKREVRGS